MELNEIEKHVKMLNLKHNKSDLIYIKKALDDRLKWEILDEENFLQKRKKSVFGIKTQGGDLDDDLISHELLEKGLKNRLKREALDEELLLKKKASDKQLDLIKKAQMVKPKVGSGDLFQSSANAYRRQFCNGKARDLYEGEVHPLCANFLGPGTRIDLQEVVDFPPYNKADSVARKHDLAYNDAFLHYSGKAREKKIREADKDFLAEIEEAKDEEPYYSIGKYGIGAKVALEDYPVTKDLFNDTYRGSSGGRICKKCDGKGGCLHCLRRGGCVKCS